MTKYRVQMFFTNLDNSLYTHEQAVWHTTIDADDYTHADLLVERFRKMLDGDHFIIEEVK
jgi:hypothetical protein